MTAYVFKYGIGGHYLAAILDLKVNMVSKHGKTFSFY